MTTDLFGAGLEVCFQWWPCLLTDDFRGPLSFKWAPSVHLKAPPVPYYSGDVLPSLVGESPSCSPVSSSSSPQKHTRKIQFSIFKSLPPLPYTLVLPLTLFAPLTPSPRPLTLSPRPLYRHPAPTINIVLKDFLQLTRRKSKQEHDVLRKAHVTYEQDRGLETRIKCSQLSKLLNKPRVGTPALNCDLQKPQLPVCLEVMSFRGEKDVHPRRWSTRMEALEGMRNKYKEEGRKRRWKKAGRQRNGKSERERSQKGGTQTGEEEVNYPSSQMV